MVIAAQGNQWRPERERNYLTRALINNTVAEISIKETI
jgi:hypothetical protein